MADAPAARVHEPDLPRVRAIAIGGGAVLAMVVIAVIIAVIVVRGLAPERGAPRAAVPPAAEPPLQAMPERDFPAYLREKQTLLHEYAWVDRAHGIVRIPVERAMSLLVEQQAQRGSAQ
jgi:hypothetical protein